MISKLQSQIQQIGYLTVVMNSRHVHDSFLHDTGLLFTFTIKEIWNVHHSMLYKLLLSRILYQKNKGSSHF